MKLLDHYLSKGYTVYTDNFSNSVRLTRELTLHNTYICDTLRQDRKGNPKEVIYQNLIITKKKLKQGEVIWRRNESVAVCKWRDRRDVLMISNKHNVEMAEVTNRRGQSREKPKIVCDYNEGMSGIDRSDQMLSCYQGLRKSIRWYKKLGFHYLEMFVFNAHCLHTKYGNEKLRLLDFCLAVIKNLVGNVRSESNLNKISKFHCLKQFKAKPDLKKKYPSYKCKFCSSGNSSVRHESRFYCEACPEKPALCIDPCFKLFHEKMRNKVSEE